MVLGIARVHRCQGGHFTRILSSAVMNKAVAPEIGPSPARTTCDRAVHMAKSPAFQNCRDARRMEFGGIIMGRRSYPSWLPRSTHTVAFRPPTLGALPGARRLAADTLVDHNRVVARDR